MRRFALLVAALLCAASLGSTARAGSSAATIFGGAGVFVEDPLNFPGPWALADELQAAAAAGASATSVDPGGPIGGEVVVLALYYPETLEAVAQYRDQLAGRVVVDISNPIDYDTMDGLVVGPDTSGAEEVAEQVPPGTPVVKAFNTTFAKVLVPGQLAGQQPDVLIAGDDEDAKQKVASLAKAGGLRPIDVGPLRRARQEDFHFLQVVAQEPVGAQYDTHFKLLP
jgi:predicted dinucleotide-binding enzyme